MFKKGQVWRSNFSGNLFLVVRVPKKHFCEVLCIAGSSLYYGGHLGAAAAETSYKLIGNNYQARTKTQKGEEEAAPMPHETHNLIQNLRRDNKELRRQNKDLRDDIGDMASKLHLAFRNKFPGIAALWPTPEALPEQRGCRKEDC
ncbi:hypothetical protein [Escherichia coli]|uniref:hypothetical protein n=1 Tax=Escherichia coli TaxID=562 RepID=UPI001F313C6F|nr:hypothetical protein [Escherichia coli]